MSTLQRVSPLLTPAGGTPVEIARSIKTLEEMPKIPDGTPTSATNGYEGQIMADASYLYIYRAGWKRAALSAVP